MKSCQLLHRLDARKTTFVAGQSITATTVAEFVDVHAEISQDERRMTAERVRNERVAETGHHARVEHNEAGLVLPRQLTGRSQQVLHGQNSHRHHPYMHTSLIQ